MGQRHRVIRLPKAVREMVDRLIDDGRTLDEIVAVLRELPLQPEALPSRSAVHRYRKQLAQHAADRDRSLAARLDDIERKLDRVLALLPAVPEAR